MGDLLEQGSIFCSIASFLISIVLWVKTGEIKKDLFTKNRLPKIARNFELELNLLFVELRNWHEPDDGRQVHLKLSSLHSMLLSLDVHLSYREKKRMLAKLKNFIEHKGADGKVRPIAQMSEDESWEASVDLNALSTALKSKVLDMRAPQ